MKKYILGLFLVLLVVGCNQQATAPVTTDTGTDEPIADSSVQVTGDTGTDNPMSVEQKSSSDVQATENVASVSDTVKILGKQGFDPEELTVKAGTAVEFINEDPAEKVMIITFQKDGSRQFENSDKMPAGATYEKRFSEPGRYDYWTQAYGVKAVIIVE